MTLGNGHVRDTTGARLSARTLRDLCVGDRKAVRAGGRTIGDARIQGDAVEAARHSNPSGAREERDAATAATAGSVALIESEGLRGPGVSTGAAARLYGESAFATAGRQYDDRATAAAAAAGVI